MGVVSLLFQNYFIAFQKKNYQPNTIPHHSKLKPMMIQLILVHLTTLKLSKFSMKILLRTILIGII